MKSVNSRARRALAGAVIAAALAAATAPVLAGGPLYLVPTANGLEPLRWQGTVPVYTDLGPLGTLDNAKGNELTQNTLTEWSSVSTSSFRAQIAGNFADLGLGDITAANAGTVIGTYNGGGVHVIYDSDGSVIADFIGAGYGVLGIATPEFLAADGSNEIVEGWVIVNGQPDWLDDPTGGPVAGVITHEFGHAINLAHSQTNGLYYRNQPIEIYGQPAGLEQAGPDQCGPAVAAYPTPEQVETMFPYIDPNPTSPTYNSPQMATVNVADDRAALSAIYPAPGFRQSTGTLIGRIVAKDGASELTGINVIARRVGDPFDAISRISGDSTQGILGPDGSFEMSGLTPGVQYLVYIDQLGAGGFSTPKAVLLGPEEYWNAGESRDATVDNPCASTPITVAAGDVRQIEIALNGIDRAPAFTHIPYSLPLDISRDGRRIVGLYAPFQSPYWVWTKRRGMSFIDGSGFIGAISGDGKVVGGTIPKLVDTPYGPVQQERAALWTREQGWRSIAGNRIEGCDIFHTSVFDVDDDGSTAVGLAFGNCSDAYAFKWTAKGGMKRLHKISTGSARANAVAGNGALVGGWEEVPEAFGFRVGSLWQGKEQMLLSDPSPGNPLGFVGEVMAINQAGNLAVGINAGVDLKDAFEWTAASGVINLGRYPGQFCYSYYDWLTGELIETCEDRETLAFSLSDDGKVITGSSRLFNAGIDDAAIYTRGLGWMLLSDFLEGQGVLETSRWVIIGARVSGDGKNLTGTAIPLGSDYWQGYKLELDQVFVCHDKRHKAKSIRVGFPEEMDERLRHGDTIGLCPGDRPL